MFSHNKRLIALAIAASSASGAVQHAMAASAAEEIAQINESIAILTAKRAEIELRAQIAAKQAEIRKITDPRPETGPSKNTTVTEMLTLEREPVPVVRGIEGIDGNLTALLSFGSGMQQTVKQGEKIYGNWVVTEIGVSSVTITRGREQLRLSFGSDPTGNQTETRVKGLSLPPLSTN